MMSFRYLVLATLLALPFSAAHAVKTDTVVLVNGNAVTGEIKSLEFGSLKYSTDSMGTVGIDWEDIVALSSNQALQVEVTSGQRYFGSLQTTGERFHVIVKTASEDIVLSTHDIVRITPIETADKFWQRIDGSFSLGMQTQKSSDVTTSNVAADMSYRTRRYLVGLRLNSSVTDQPDRPVAARQNVGANYQRFLPNRWFTDWFTSWEKNDELGIQSRVSAGGALGRYVIQTNKNQLSLTLGAQAARETFTGELPGETKGEGRIEIRYLRRNLTPESSLRFTTQIYPLLENLSFYRAETDLTWRHEWIEDLFLDLTLGHSYQSDPPVDAEKSDYVFTTSLGYSF